MGCGHSDIFPDSVINSFPSIDIESLKNNHNIILEPKDIDLVQSSWKLVSNPKELGIIIMVKLFTQQKEIKSLWIFASQLEKEEEIRKSAKVVYHASRIMDIIDHVISNLKEPSKIDIKSIVDLGRKHYDYGVKERYFKNFEICLITSLASKLSQTVFDEECQMAWRRLYWSIVGRLVFGSSLAEKNDH